MNINAGICHRRIQEGRPPYFVNWHGEGVNEYAFFSFPWQMELCKERLKSDFDLWSAAYLHHIKSLAKT